VKVGYKVKPIAFNIARASFMIGKTPPVNFTGLLAEDNIHGTFERLNCPVVPDTFGVRHSDSHSFSLHSCFPFHSQKSRQV
jgi:hypothetical protein